MIWNVPGAVGCGCAQRLPVCGTHVILELGRYDINYEEQGSDYPLGYIRWTEGRNFEAVVDLMSKGKLKVQPLITHRFPIEQGIKAYEVITGNKKEKFLGVVLTYPATTDHRPQTVVNFTTAVSRQPSAVVKLGVLGAGLLANAAILPAIKKAGDIHLIGIASAGGLHAQHSGKKFGFQYATSSDDEIINDPNINTVAILTRHERVPREPLHHRASTVGSGWWTSTGRPSGPARSWRTRTTCSSTRTPRRRAS